MLAMIKKRNKNDLIYDLVEIFKYLGSNETNGKNFRKCYKSLE